tara:strand:- start:285 stop:491 length:207 start_codon:yes stop_codon:yes gene_type:complete
MSKLEKNIQELEIMLNTLESGDITLDDAIKTYEKGIKLAKDTFQTLDNKESKITSLQNSAKTLLNETP